MVTSAEGVESGSTHVFIHYDGFCCFDSEHTETVKKLASLHILNEQSQTGRLPGWRLNEVFRKNLKIALTGGYAVQLMFILLFSLNLSLLILITTTTTKQTRINMERLRLKPLTVNSSLFCYCCCCCVVVKF